MSSLAHASISAKIMELNPPRLFVDDQGDSWFYLKERIVLLQSYIMQQIVEGAKFFFDDFWKLDIHYGLGKWLENVSLDNSFGEFYQAAITAGNDSARRSLIFWWEYNLYNPQ